MRGFLISAPETLAARSAWSASELTSSLIAASLNPEIAYCPSCPTRPHPPHRAAPLRQPSRRD